jgi:hypothetical protein
MLARQILLGLHLDQTAGGAFEFDAQFLSLR